MSHKLKRRFLFLSNKTQNSKQNKTKKVIYRAPSCGKQYPFFQNGVGVGGHEDQKAKEEALYTLGFF